MIKFVYSEKVNQDLLKYYLPGLRGFCDKHDLVFFETTQENKEKVEKWVSEVKFPEIEGDITCYIRYFGTWGSYHPEDNWISICPLDLDKLPGGLVDLVKHELLHLQHPEAESMSHEDKEDYITGLENGSKGY